MIWLIVTPIRHLLHPVELSLNSLCY